MVRLTSKILVLVAFSLVQIKLLVAGSKIVCYHTNWSQYRPGDGKFVPEDIDPFLCTHIIYSFAKVQGDRLAPYEWNDESTPWSKGMYERTTDLKKINPNLKILLAVGGWTHGSGPFSTMVHNQDLRRSFVASTVDYLKQHNFDGLDLDWEYPGSREGSQPSDKQLFTLFISELKAAFEADNLLLTAAVAAGKSNIDNGYEIDKISKDLDFINLMAYDLHGTWEQFTGHHAALYSRPDETGDQAILNVDWAVNYWLSKGCPSHKLILGLGTYGRAFKLVSSSNNGMGATANGNPSAGTYTREGGFLSYYEVCQRLSQGWTRKWHDAHAVPYAFNSQEWVGYDDKESLRAKTDYIKNKGLGGAMFWALDLDDFNGKFCNDGKYPLIKSVKANLGISGPIASTTITTSGTIASTTTAATVQTTPAATTASATTTKPPNPNEKCYKGDGFYADKESGCRRYYVCNYTGTQYATVTYHECPHQLLFDELLVACNYANLVQC